jgi:hypothetical protein
VRGLSSSPTTIIYGRSSSSTTTSRARSNTSSFVRDAHKLIARKVC